MFQLHSTAPLLLSPQGAPKAPTSSGNSTATNQHLGRAITPGLQNMSDKAWLNTYVASKICSIL